MIISRLIAPGTVSDCLPLYYRGDGENADRNELRIRPQGVLSLDTYFNALFYGPYLRYTRIETVSLRIVISGTAHLFWFVAGQDGRSVALAEMQTEGERETVRFAPISLQELPLDGMLYLSVRAKDSEVLLHEVNYETQIEPLPIMLAAVICTYRREAFVLRNLNAIRSGIREREPELNGCLDVILADNGKSLSIPDEPQTVLLPGKNCGGSGGFTRGLLAAYLSRRYTHVLFMDDDIVFESETLARTIRFLQVANQTEQPMCIGGHMLIKDRPTIQYEAGASYVHGWLRPNGRGVDLAERGALLENARPRASQFNSWWYCCFPIKVVDEIGLPLPLFIKADDVEYGLRMQPEVVHVNGIGVWHMAFAEKYSPHLEYYIKRNELLVSAIHGSGDSVLVSAVKLTGCCFHALQLKQGARIEFALRGYDDFLKGPDFLLKTDPEALNTELLAQRAVLETKQPCLCKQIKQITETLLKLVFSYGKARKAFRTRIHELTSVTFWRSYLSNDGNAELQMEGEMKWSI